MSARRHRSRSRAVQGAYLAACLYLLSPLAAFDEFEPAATGGVEAVDHALASLQRHQRLLVVGAHPDDEDTTLLTWIARAEAGEAAYLSLTRGDGGQNLVGEEAGEALGILRTEELLAARRVDGARQYFTRAYDFGYTRSIEETLERWPKEELLRDVVRIVRTFRPQVMVSVFPPTSEAGHGQHQAAGILAVEAFHAAGDPSVFPDQAAEGLSPWSPTLLYREAWWNPEDATLTLPADAVDPFRGRSVSQIASESRSQHRSQSMGRLQDPGPRVIRLVRMEGPSEAPGDRLFGDLSTELDSLADLAQGGRRDAVRAALVAIRARATGARQTLVPSRLDRAAEPLAAIVRDLVALRRSLADLGPLSGSEVHLDALLAEKEEIANRGLRAAAGVFFDAWTDTPEVVAGTEATVTATVWNSGPFSLALTGDAVLVSSPARWLSAPVRGAIEATGAEEARDPVRSGRLGPGELGRARLALKTREDALPTVPYFLRRPRPGDLYRWDRSSPDEDVGSDPRGLPFGPEPLRAELDAWLELNGERFPVRWSRAVVARRSNLATGELREPLRLVPRIEVAVEPSLLVWPLPGPASRTVEVRLTLHGEGSLAGTLLAKPPPGWPSIRDFPFRLSAREPELSVTVEVSRPADAERARGTSDLELVAISESGRSFAVSLPLVRAPHVRPRPFERPAVAAIRTFPFTPPAVRLVAYVPGAGDRVPGALEEVGIPLVTLDGEALAREDLFRFDAIVVGSRAYEVDPSLPKLAARFRQYLEAGGLLLVQFQRWEYFRDGLAPVALAMEGRGRRTTDEAAPVTVLRPDHRAFRAPNLIEPADWDDWVQERGVYYPTFWEPGVTPLLSLADVDDPDQRGSLLVATVGEGTYVYTGLAFFRQLPAGVPGAFRLFANLLDLESDREPTP